MPLYSNFYLIITSLWGVQITIRISWFLGLRILMRLSWTLCQWFQFLSDLHKVFESAKIVPNTVRLEFYKFRLTSSRSCSFSSSSLLDSTATRFRLRWESLPSFEGLPILICSDKKARKLRRIEPRCSMGLKTWLGYQFCYGSQSLGLNREARSLGLAWLPSLLSFPDHNMYTSLVSIFSILGTLVWLPYCPIAKMSVTLYATINVWKNRRP